MSARAVTAGLVLAATVAWAGEGVRLRSPLPFDHAAHAKTFDKAGLSCIDCHPVGARRATPDGVELALPEGPTSTCHGCHLGEVARAPRSSPGECLLCHADRTGLTPPDHALDWIALHGDQSRAAGNGCDTCHRPSECLDCHDRRGAGSQSPHMVGFRSTHGVEARLDPRACATCHTEASCAACHDGGAGPW